MAANSTVVAIGSGEHGEVIGGWDRDTGRRRWTIEAPQGETILGVDAGDGVVLAGFGSGSASDGQGFADFEVRAYNVADGTELWSVADAGVEPQATFHGVAVLQRGGGGGPIFGVDVTTGKQRWRREGNWTTHYRADANGELAITGDDRLVQEVIDIVTGETRWHVGNGRSVSAAPPTGFLLATDYVGASFRLVDTDGAEIGQVQLPEPSLERDSVALAVGADNMVYGGRGCPSEQLALPDDATSRIPP